MFNNLTLKTKITLAVSILFLLLILPSYKVFSELIYKYNLHNKQLVAISYNEYIQNFTKNIQNHRGLYNAFLNGNSSFSDEISKSQDSIDLVVENLLKHDKQSLNILKNNDDFAKALNIIALIKLDKVSKNITKDEIFNKHSQIINLLSKIFQQISINTSFSLSYDVRVTHISQLLEEKIPLLQETTGQLRGLAVGIFAKKKVSIYEKEKILSLYTIIKSLENNLLNTKVLNKTDNYLIIKKQIMLVNYKLDNLLYIVNNNILIDDNISSTSNDFFRLASNSMNEQYSLNKLFSKEYMLLVEKLQEELVNKIIRITIGFFLILLSSLLIFRSLYMSISLGFKKIEDASKKISLGDMDINIEIESNDELSHVLKAYNDMSAKLSENISFLNAYKIAIDESSIVTKGDLEGNIIYVNDKFCEISGYSRDELIGKSHNILRHEGMPKSIFEGMWTNIKNKKVWNGVLKNKSKDGKTYIVNVTVVPILDKYNNIIEFVGIRHDITDLEKNKEEIKHHKIDMLTGLYNRRKLLDDLDFASRPILIYLNIDDFSKLNDFYGSSVGDKVLIHLAKLFKEISINEDFKLYKLYADEYALLFEETGAKKFNYENIISEIIEYIELKTVDGDSQSSVSITLTGGLASYKDSNDFKNLLSNAITAKKLAKNLNEKYLTYNVSMLKDVDYQNNIQWVNKIKNAIAEDRILTFFQPIIDNKTKKISKYESLVRMMDKDGVIITPFFFLDIAKKAKLYTKITKIVIDKSFAAFKDYPQFEFSINITIDDIYDKKISTYLLQKIRNFPHPDKIVIEITEDQEIQDYETINIFIKSIKKYGVKIAIDDFGTGYSNFEHILSIDVDYIKIDGSLIKNIVSDKDSEIITKAIIAFSKKLGTKTIVEYVHTAEVYEKVKELEADFSQGYFLGEPEQELIFKVIES